MLTWDMSQLENTASMKYGTVVDAQKENNGKGSLVHGGKILVQSEIGHYCKIIFTPFDFLALCTQIAASIPPTLEY